MRTLILVTTVVLALTGLVWLSLSESTPNGQEVTVRRQGRGHDLVPPTRSTVEILSTTVSEDDGGPSSAVYGIIFPDRSTARVTIRPLPFVTPDQLDNLADHYGPLAAAAENGDADAAFTLSSNLYNCELFAYESEEELQEQIDSLASNLSYLSPTGVQRDARTDQNGNADVLKESEQLRATTKRCMGLTRDRKLESSKWLALASEFGNVQAAMELANITPLGPESFAAQTRAWELGSGLHLSRLAYVYSTGGDDVKVDPIRAYAYALLNYELRNIIYSDRFGKVSGFGQSPRRYAALEERAHALSHAEAQRAVELAKNILSSNENCCYGLFMAEAPTATPY